MSQEPPSALTARCAGCGQETLHAVLKGTAGSRGGAFTFDGTVQCTECGHVHHVVVKEAPPVDVALVVSKGDASRRTRFQLGGDEEVEVGDTLVVEGLTCVLTGIESKDGRRVEAAASKDVQTLWVKEFEELAVGFAINLGHKTITKAVPAPPSREFTVGEEFVFGRLRVTVHGIKTKERLLKRGSAEAGEIVRVFAKPTPLAPKKQRPDKRAREQLRDREERKAERGGRTRRG